MPYRIGQILIGTLLCVPLGHAQTPAPAPEFEVASVKLDADCANYRGGGGVPFSTGRLNLRCTSLQDLIQTSFGMFADGGSFSPGMTPISISGAPGWVQSDRFDVAAKAGSAARVEEMMGPMMRALLEDRFKLKLHRESKEMPIYALTVAKNGFKLQPAKEDGCIPIDLNHLPAPPEPGKPMPNFCVNMSMRMGPQGQTLDAHGMSVKDFAQALTRFVDRKVVDKSGIAGKFDFHLEFARDEMSGFPGRGGDAGNNAPPAASDKPSIFSALQEQLGLKLMPDKGPVESLAIDHVEKPAEN